MPHPYSKNQLFEQPIINPMILQPRGWVAIQMSGMREADFAERLLAIASGLGTPTPTRSTGGVFDVLFPTEAVNAKPRSLSKLYATGEFPLHVDTAHWLTPCRYIMLACLSAGTSNRPTLLMDTRQLRLSARQTSLLHSNPLRVTNGRNSFFSTILSKSRSFVRFDPGCMTSTTPDGVETLGVLAQQNWPHHVEQFCWEPGVVLVLDNWRMLHGRAAIDVPDPDRKLLRISIR